MGLARLLHLLARHGSSYAELMAGVWGESKTLLGNRLAFGLAGAILAMGGIVTLWGTLILVLWDSASRNVVAASTAVLLLVAGALCLWRAVSRSTPGPHRSRLSRELQLDLELLQEWKRQNP